MAAAALCALAAALALAGWRHEPWFDEAQAWLVARDAPLGELLSTWLRYEGNPGLWHALLAAPARLGAPYATMRVLSAALALLAAWLLLFRSPLPLAARVAIPFAYFPLFQYAVVSRPYALAAPALYALAALWPRRFARPAAFAALLAGLACVSVPGTLIAAALAALHSSDVWRARAALSPATLRAHALGMALLLALGLALVALLWPPTDHVAIPAGPETHPRAAFANAWALLNGALTGFAPTTLGVLLVALAWLRQRRALGLFLAPALALLAFAGVAHAHPWHEGMLFLLLVFALWASWPADARERPMLRAAGAAAAALVLSLHLSWSYATLRFDWTNAYSAGRDVATFLRENASEGDRIFATGYGAFAIQPYFASNRFDNYRGRTGPAFFDWRRTTPLVTDYAAILRARPEFVVVAVKYPEQETLLQKPEALFPGYAPRVFLGALWWKNAPLEWEACVVYQRR